LDTTVTRPKAGGKPGPRGRASAQRPLAENMYQQLRDLIVSLKLSPGTALSESDLTARLGVSRTPIRQALHRLQQEGFAVVAAVGAVARIVVAPMTNDDMRELHGIVGVLEGLAARDAAALPDEPRAVLTQELARLNAELRAAWQAGPAGVRQAQDLHVQFHRAFVQVAAGPRLMAELNALQPQVERYERVYTGAHSQEFEESLREHDAIVAAIAHGDVDGAERAVVTNWRSGTIRYTHIVASFGERGNW
jgi:DNA-binding GntR family transcriptional regulator